MCFETPSPAPRKRLSAIYISDTDSSNRERVVLFDRFRPEKSELICRRGARPPGGIVSWRDEHRNG
jgi:hypothetical protein